MPDNTAEIQALIDSARTTYDPVAPMIPVQLPPGPLYVSSLNMSGRTGISLRGPSLLIPIASDAVVLDLSGSANIQLRDIRIGGSNDLSVHPKVGILVSQVAGPLDGLSNKLLFDYVQVDGDFTVGTLFVMGVPSSQITNSQFTQHGTTVNAWFTGNWWWENMSPYQTMVAHWTSMPTDWTIVGTEFHNYNPQTAIWIGGAQDLRWYGGNASANAFPCVDLNGVTLEGHTVAPARLIFDGTTFYSDSGNQGASAIRLGGHSPSTVILRGNSYSQPLLTA